MDLVIRSKYLETIADIGWGFQEISDMRIRKSHFHVKVLRYLTERKKNVTSPISRAEVLKYGLLDYVKKLGSRQYQFLPTVTYGDIESFFKKRVKVGLGSAYAITKKSWRRK